MNTPILILIFNRPGKTKGLFDILKDQKPAKLYIAADGPRNNKEGEAALCNETRSIFDKIDWECEVRTRFLDHNLGCGKGVSSAISWFFENEEAGIILEDDCHPNNDFFVFCEQMLTKYRNNTAVKIISGSNFQNGLKWGSASYYFSGMGHIWGWATWRRTWAEYEFDMDKYDDSFKKVIEKRFSNKRMRLYWEYIFDMMKNNPVDTWDYQLSFSILKNGGINIIPNRNLVTNVGFGSDATHTHEENAVWANRESFQLGTIKHPATVRCNNLADIFYHYHNELKRKPRLMHRVRRVLHLY